MDRLYTREDMELAFFEGSNHILKDSDVEITVKELTKRFNNWHGETYTDYPQPEPVEKADNMIKVSYKNIRLSCGLDTFLLHVGTDVPKHREGEPNDEDMFDCDLHVALELGILRLT
jgi:hypothetical protein